MSSMRLKPGGHRRVFGNERAAVRGSGYGFLCAGAALLVLAGPARAEPTVWAELRAPQPRFGLADEAGGSTPEATTPTSGEVSGPTPFVAGLLSAVVPGTGQLVQGQSRGWLYLGIEAASWFAYFALQNAGDQALEDAYDYVGDVESFDARWTWDRYKANPPCGDGLGPRDDFEAEQARLQDLYDNALDEFYSDIGSENIYACGWVDQSARAEYLSMVDEADSFYSSSDVAVTVVVFNHLVSAIDAAKSAPAQEGESHAELAGAARTQGLRGPGAVDPELLGEPGRMWKPVSLVILAGLVRFASPAAAGDEVGTPLLGPDRIYSSDALLAAVAETPDTTGSLDLNAVPSPPNGKLAMLMSLVVPGTGELYLGSPGRAAIFFVAEAAIWTSYFVFQSEGNHREDLYQQFAAIHAGVPVRNDDEFYRILGNYISSDGPYSANERVRREARAIFPGNREKQEQYIAENAYTGDNSWEWDSQASFDRFQEMRSSSLDSYQYANLSLGLLVANRIVSVVDTGLLAASKNRELAQQKPQLSWNFTAGRNGPGAQVVLSRSF